MTCPIENSPRRAIGARSCSTIASAARRGVGHRLHPDMRSIVASLGQECRHGGAMHAVEARCRADACQPPSCDGGCCPGAMGAGLVDRDWSTCE